MNEIYECDLDRERARITEAFADGDLDEIRAAATEVLACIDDEKTAHVLEDDLYVAVLRAVADGHPHAQAMAVEALRVADSVDVRWYG